MTLGVVLGRVNTPAGGGSTTLPSAAVRTTSGPYTTVPPTLNWHLTPHCNYRCKFCFATYNDTDKSAALQDKETMMQV
jgi:2-iminoacetate synthase ThiH